MGRRVGITRDQIIDAAAAIADRDGLAGVTVARVAAALSVKPPSLYNHVNGLEGVLRLLGQRGAVALHDTLARAAAADDPIRAMAAAYRTFAREHPGLYAAAQPVAARPADSNIDAAMARIVGVLTEALRCLGVPEDRLIHAVHSLRALLHGFAALEAGGGFSLEHDPGASFAFAVDLYLRGLPRAG